MPEFMPSEHDDAVFPELFEGKRKGHGHVTPNADGSRARCGGPKLCDVCQRELAALRETLPAKPYVGERRETRVEIFERALREIHRAGSGANPGWQAERAGEALRAAGVER